MEIYKNLRLYRKTARRMLKIIKQANRHLEDVCRTQSDDKILVAFMQHLHKMSELLALASITGTIDGNSSRWQEMVMALIAQLGFLEFEREVMVLTDAICHDYLPHVKGWEKPLRQIARCEGWSGGMFNLRDRLGALYKVRNAYTLAEHNYGDYEVPDFEIAYIRNEDGTTCMGEELSKEPLERLALFVNTRLWRFYNLMIERMDPWMRACIQRDEQQKGFDLNTATVDAIFRKEVLS